MYGCMVWCVVCGVWCVVCGVACLQGGGSSSGDGRRKPTGELVASDAINVEEGLELLDRHVGPGDSRDVVCDHRHRGDSRGEVAVELSRVFESRMSGE